SVWLASQERYANQELEKLFSENTLGSIDGLRKLGWVVPLLTPAYCLLLKGLILDGRAGWMYAAQRTYAELLLGIKVLDRRFRHPQRVSHLRETRHLGL